MPGPYKCTHQQKKLLSPHAGRQQLLFTMLRQHECLQGPDTQDDDAQAMRYQPKAVKVCFLT